MFGKKMLDRFFTSRYNVGQRVIHIPTGFLGRIVEVQFQNGRQLISANFDNGRAIILEDRRLFQAAARG